MDQVKIMDMNQSVYVEYLNYKLYYSSKVKNIVKRCYNANWQKAIENWKSTNDKSLYEYKRHRNSISSLKNRVFSAEEWNLVEDIWDKISNNIKIDEKTNPIELYVNLTGEQVDGIQKSEKCLDLFNKFKATKNNGKRFSNPRAEIYRLLAAYNLDVF